MEIKINVTSNEEDQLYELADEYLSDFYDRNGIEELYEIDDAEY